MQDAPLVEVARFLRRVQWVLGTLAVLWLVGLLAPVLTPFVLGALLGWLGDPLVDRLVASGRSRAAAVTLVFTGMVLSLLAGLVLLVPLLERQVGTLFESLPGYTEWFIGTALPWIEARTGLAVTTWLDPARLVQLVRQHWEQAGGAAATVLGYLSRSGFALLAWLANIVLVPVLTFFFLRDWDMLVARVASLIPRDRLPTVTRLAKESDAVLGGFLRGQLLVMLVLGVFYGLGLWIVGLDLGLLIGLLAGLFTFVPYLGPAVGILLGVVAAMVQFGDWQHVAGVLAVFGIGQVVETYWLTPKLVGDRIGLHPMAVIFAVMAGGVLFGFLGMLLALPVAAVANVLLRFAEERYTHSRLYAGEHPGIAVPGSGPAPPPGPPPADPA